MSTSSLEIASPPASADRFRDMADNAPVLIWVSGPEMLLHSFNATWQRFTGRPLGESSTREWTNLIHPDDRELCVCTYRRAFEAREHFRMEYRLRRHDGLFRWVLDTGTPRFSPQEAFLGYIGSCVDITELKVAEQALRESEERYRIVAENSNDAIVTMDERGGILYASPAIERTFGVPPRQLPGRALDSLVPGLFAAIAEAGPANAREFVARHPSGGEIILEVSRSEFLKGGARLYIVFLRDITSRRRAELEIQNLAAFPRFNPDPVLEFSSAGVITYFNHAAALLAKSLGRDHPSQLLPDGADRQARDCLATGQSKLRIENCVAGRTIAWSFFPVQQIQRVHCYAVDVTERVNLEAQMRHAQKMESVGRLAAGVAHDFNNLLTVIRGHAGMLQTGLSMAPDQSESLRQIAQAAGTAANLTRQLLTFSRKQVLAPRMLDLNHAITETLKMLKRVIGEDVQINFSYVPHLLPVYADEGMLEQVLMNLAVNARDAMPNGGRVTIRTSPVELDDAAAAVNPEACAGRFNRITFSDTGCGMDSATLSRIFEPFFTTKDHGKGTGLGLATVYGIVKQHQGWLQVESKLGAGTTFQIYLPVCDESAIPSAAMRPLIEVPGGAETILVVEDEEAVLELASSTLASRGYNVLTATCGPKALKIWSRSRHQIDLLLTDMVMPNGLTGRELAEILQADKRTLKVLFTSGYAASLGDQNWNLREDVNFLPKPYTTLKLAQAVRECLDRPTQVLRS